MTVTLTRNATAGRLGALAFLLSACGESAKVPEAGNGRP